MAGLADDVSSLDQSGKHMLAQSFSGFDPTETSAARFSAMRCIALARRSY
jgi:hypothetical protein